MGTVWNFEHRNILCRKIATSAGSAPTFVTYVALKPNSTHLDLLWLCCTKSCTTSCTSLHASMLHNLLCTTNGSAKVWSNSFVHGRPDGMGRGRQVAPPGDEVRKRWEISE